MDDRASQLRLRATSGDGRTGPPGSFQGSPSAAATRLRRGEFRVFLRALRGRRRP
jgi:hypothetical protein